MRLSFVDHLAPIWRALDDDVRGAFRTPHTRYVRRLGIDPERGLSRSHDPALVASWGDTQIAQQRSRAVARMEHGIGQSYAGVPNIEAATHPSYAGGRHGARIGLFLVPNEHSAERWRRAYPEARVEIIGSPRLDVLPAYAPDEPELIAVSFHWNAVDVVPETRSAFEDYQDALLALARRRHVVLHSHPRDAHVIRRWALRAGLEFVETFAEVVRRAALYVADNTSTLYEFASTGRPVVVLNRPTVRDRLGRVTQCGYRRTISHGLRFWEAADVGVQVDAPGELEDAVGRALDDDDEQRAKREHALDIVYAHRTGGTQRAAAVLADWLASIPETPMQLVRGRLIRVPA